MFERCRCRLQLTIMHRWSERKTAAAGIGAVAIGLLCMLLVVSHQFAQPGRDVLLQVGTVRANMVAMGKELEREGAKIAGAKLIREASELSTGKSRSAPRAHKLRQQTAGAPAYFTGAPFKQGSLNICVIRVFGLAVGCVSHDARCILQANTARYMTRRTLVAPTVFSWVQTAVVTVGLASLPAARSTRSNRCGRGSSRSCVGPVRERTRLCTP